MNTGWRCGLAAGALTLAAASPGCEPAPEYGPLAPPYIGEIYAENSVLTTGEAQQLGILPTGSPGQYAVTMSLPAGAYTPGILVTLRWVTDLRLVTDESLQLGSLVGNTYYSLYDALQLLPPAPVPTSPLTVTLIDSGVSTYDVLHASECDVSWQVVGTARAAPSTPNTSLSFPLSGPGLWTLGQKPGADAGMVYPGLPPPPPPGCPLSSNGEVDGGQQD